MRTLSSQLSNNVYVHVPKCSTVRLDTSASTVYDHGMTTTTDNRISLAEGKERLEAALRTLTTEERWKDLLRMKGLQHNYTMNNLLLAMGQCPEMSMIGGAKNFWKPLGRYPMKGTKAIRIFAPMIATRTEDDGTKRTFPTGFKLVPVFDVSQTDGKPLPEVTSRELGDVDQVLIDTFLAFAKDEGLNVDFETMAPGLGGYVRIETAELRLNADESGLKRFKTLTHELAHWLDREAIKGGEGKDPSPYALNEVVAESVAFVVAHAIGLDTSDYSIGYVAVWGDRDGDPIEAIKKVSKRVDAVAGKLLAVVDAFRKVAA